MLDILSKSETPITALVKTKNTVPGKDSIEPGFSGTLLLKLKNGCRDYVSRTYLPKFRKYLGL